MKFCSYCGKQLEDNETCTCRAGQQAAAGPQSMASGNSVFKDVLEHFVNCFKNPIEAAKEYYNKANVASTGILIGALTLAYLIATLFRMIYVANSFQNVWITKVVTGAVVVKTIFFPIIYMIVIFFAYMGISYLARLALKQKFDCLKTINMCGAVAVPLIIAQFIQLLNNVINVSALNAIFSSFIAVLGFVALYQGINAIKDEIDNKNKLIAYMAIMIGGNSIAHFLICLLMNTCITYVPLAF